MGWDYLLISLHSAGVHPGSIISTTVPLVNLQDMQLITPSALHHRYRYRQCTWQQKG